MADKEPAFAATVYLKNNKSVNTVADMDGKFSLIVGDTGQTDTLVVSYVGYDTYMKPVSQVVVPLDIRLIPQSVLLRSVVVKAASPLSKEFAVTSINTTDIYMYPTSSADPLKAIKMLPYSTNTTESANPELRGSAAELSRVILNEVPILNPVRNEQLNSLGNFSLFNTELIKKQSVYPGNPPLEYGDAISGIVNIRTLDHLDQEQRLDVSVSLANVGALYQKAFSDNTFLQAYTNHQFSNLYVDVNKAASKELKSFSSTDLGINLHTQFRGRLYFNEYAYIIRENYDANMGEYNYYGEQDSHKMRHFNVTNLEYNLGKLVFSFNNGIDYSRSRYNYGSIHDKTHELRLYNSLFAKYKASESLLLKGGIDDQYSRYSYKGTYPLQAYDLYPSAEMAYRNNHLSNHALEVFLFSKLKFSKLVVGAGLRKNIPLHNQDNFLSVQAILRYNLAKNHSLILSGGHYNGYSVPQYAMRYISHISSNQVSLDYLFKLGKTSFSFSGYYKKENTPEFMFKTNNSRDLSTYIKGMELSTKVPVGLFQFWSSLTFLNVKFKETGSNTKFRAENDIHSIFKCSVEYMNDKLFNASLSFTTRPGLYYTPLLNTSMTEGVVLPMYGDYNSRHYPNYASLDLSINRCFQFRYFGVATYVTANNLLDRENTQNYYYDKSYENRVIKLFQRRVIYFGFVFRF